MAKKTTTRVCVLVKGAKQCASGATPQKAFAAALKKLGKRPARGLRGAPSSAALQRALTSPDTDGTAGFDS